MKITIFSIILTLFLCGCDFKASVSSGKELKGEGITFIVEFETSSSSQGSGGITYNSATVKASTDGKSLTFNGKNYGALKAGDKVDLREPGKVLVNGIERKSATP